MNEGLLSVMGAEKNKWRHVLDAAMSKGFEEAMRLARKCQHPDAVWFSSLFPAGVAVTDRRVAEVMREQGDDPRALLLLWKAKQRLYRREVMASRDAVITAPTNELLLRAAEMGYAPAQADAAHEFFREPGGEGFRWAQRATAAGDHRGMFMLGHCYYEGHGCAKDGAKALELFRDAAILGDSMRSMRTPRRDSESWTGSGSTGTASRRKEGNIRPDSG
jgi:hypothetical protein